ncbi:hypothetical protein AC1031_014833 [Aphanomyces cochlioides]|nr:hypothetical protein AC1031_014833 [Aphanomyces cochlioides]
MEQHDPQQDLPIYYFNRMNLDAIVLHPSFRSLYLYKVPVTTLPTSITMSTQLNQLWIAWNGMVNIPSPLSPTIYDL